MRRFAMICLGLCWLSGCQSGAPVIVEANLPQVISMVPAERAPTQKLNQPPAPRAKDLARPQNPFLPHGAETPPAPQPRPPSHQPSLAVVIPGIRPTLHARTNQVRLTLPFPTAPPAPVFQAPPPSFSPPVVYPPIAYSVPPPSYQSQAPSNWAAPDVRRPSPLAYAPSPSYPQAQIPSQRPSVRSPVDYPQRLQGPSGNGGRPSYNPGTNPYPVGNGGNGGKGGLVRQSSRPPFSNSRDERVTQEKQLKEAYLQSRADALNMKYNGGRPVLDKYSTQVSISAGAPPMTYQRPSIPGAKNDVVGALRASEVKRQEWQNYRDQPPTSTGASYPVPGPSMPCPPKPGPAFPARY